MFFDLLADFTVRLRCGCSSHSKFVYVPYTKLNIKLLRFFVERGCISSFYIDIDQVTAKLRVRVSLKYVLGRPLLSQIILVSKPGLRVYWSAGQLAAKLTRNAFQGFYIISTSAGLCTSSELILLRILDKRLSGEVLLRVSF